MKEGKKENLFESGWHLRCNQNKPRAALTHRRDSTSDTSCPVITSLSLGQLQRDDLRGSDNKHTRLRNPAKLLFTSLWSAADTWIFLNHTTLLPTRVYVTDAMLYSHCKIGTTHYYIKKSRGKISPKGWGAELRNVGMCCIIESYHESYSKFLLHVHMVPNACGRLYVLAVASMFLL